MLVDSSASADANSVVEWFGLSQLSQSHVMLKLLAR